MRWAWLLLLLLAPACAPVVQVRPAGVSGRVQITFDRWGVPHIRAQSDLDVFFAQGYVHARDRLFQMELGRRAAQGRLAEVLGASLVEQDRFFRTWGLYRAAEASLPYHSDFARQALEAYAAGVNWFIREGELPLPFRLLGFAPEPWKPADSLAWGKLQSYDLGQTWQDEIDNLYILSKVGREGFEELRGGYPEGWPTVLQPEDLQGVSREEKGTGALPWGLWASLRRVSELSERLILAARAPEQGSNNWVLSGSRTLTGKPMLANDPHLRLQNPALWYLVDLRGPTYRAIGASIPGVPGVILGRNDRVAWGATNVRPDVMDLFVLELEGSFYRTRLGLVPLRERQEVVRVRGGADVVFTVRESEYGPLISDLGPALLRFGLTPGVPLTSEKQAVAVRWTGLDPDDTTLDAYLGMNRAGSAAEFREALRRYVAPMQNFVYADVDGNIGYIAPGRLPLRDWDGRFPARGFDQYWRGYVPFERLPQVANPREGFVVSANNRVLPHGGPDISTYTTEVFRAQRIRELIQGQPKASLEDMARWQVDTYSLVAREMLPGLLALRPVSEAARRLQEAVRGWDLRAELDSVGATAFAFYYREVSRMLEDELGLRYPPTPYLFIKTLREDGRWCRNAALGIQNCAEFMALALERAGVELERRLGPDPSGWQWGRLHRASITSPLASLPLIGGLYTRVIPTPGSIQTVNVASYNQDTFLHTSGASLRTLFDLADLDNSRVVYPMGQSSDPFSPHYDDLLELWRDGRYIPLSTRPSDWGRSWTLELGPNEGVAVLRGYQVLVVGAGIIGAACAYRLAERGLRVGVIERAPAPAMGSTGRSAAGVRVQFTEAINILLSWHSILEYRGMPEAAYRPIGYLFLVPESRWLTHMAGVGLQRSLGVPVEVWGLEEARRRVEFRPQASGLEPVRGATFGPADGVVDPHGICLGYLQRARRLGAEVHTGVELLSARRAEGVWEVQTSGGMLYAEFILNAAGAWAGEVGRRAGLSIPVHPARRMVFCTAPGPLWDHPLTVDLHSGFWFRPEGSRLIFGRSNPADVGFREGMDWGWLEPTLEVGLARFPWLERLQLDQRASWWGYYEVTPDHNPILGWMPGVEGWVNACGFSGHGVQQAAMVGRLMAEEIADGRAHSLNIDPLRYERWSEGRGFSEGNIV